MGFNSIQNLCCDSVAVPALLTMWLYDLHIGYDRCKRRLHTACEDTVASGRVDPDNFINSIVNVQCVNMVSHSKMQ